MESAKLVLIYPRPLDERAFERVYRDVHLPMVETKLKGLNRYVTAKVASSPQGPTRTYQICEAHFSSREALQTCLESDGAREWLEHARSISTGGPPIILLCGEESVLFW